MESGARAGHRPRFWVRSIITAAKCRHPAGPECSADPDPDYRSENRGAARRCSCFIHVPILHLPDRVEVQIHNFELNMVCRRNLSHSTCHHHAAASVCENMEMEQSVWGVIVAVAAVILAIPLLVLTARQELRSSRRSDVDWQIDRINVGTFRVVNVGQDAAFKVRVEMWTPTEIEFVEADRLATNEWVDLVLPDRLGRVC